MTTTKRAFLLFLSKQTRFWPNLPAYLGPFYNNNNNNSSSYNHNTQVNLIVEVRFCWRPWEIDKFLPFARVSQAGQSTKVVPHFHSLVLLIKASTLIFLTF